MRYAGHESRETETQERLRRDFEDPNGWPDIHHGGRCDNCFSSRALPTLQSLPYVRNRPITAPQYHQMLLLAGSEALTETGTPP